MSKQFDMAVAARREARRAVDAILCTRPLDREIHGGWLGHAWNPSAKCWTVLTTVFEAKEGFATSRHWWALRFETKFGVIDRTPPYSVGPFLLGTGP